MEKDEFLKDDFLRELMQRSPLDCPSDGFIERVMADIQVSSEVADVRKPFYLYLKSALPYAVVAFVLFFVIATSDLPIFSWLPGKDHALQNLLSYFTPLVSVVKNAFATKYVSWVLLISFSTGMLFFLDRLFSRRTSL